MTTSLRWRPALLDSPAITALANAMPGTVTVLGGGTGHAITSAAVSAVVEAIVAESIERMELPAAPPNVNTPTDMRDALIGNLDGSSFRAPGALAADVARMFDAWTRTVTSGSRPRLIVQLEAPGDGPRSELGVAGHGHHPDQRWTDHAGRRGAEGRTRRTTAERGMDSPWPPVPRDSPLRTGELAGGSP